MNFDYLILSNQTLTASAKKKSFLLFKMHYWFDQIYLLSVKVIFAHKSMTDCKFINFKWVFKLLGCFFFLSFFFLKSSSFPPFPKMWVTWQIGVKLSWVNVTVSETNEVYVYEWCLISLIQLVLDSLGCWPWRNTDNIAMRWRMWLWYKTNLHNSLSYILLQNEIVAKEKQDETYDKCLARDKREE